MSTDQMNSRHGTRYQRVPWREHLTTLQSGPDTHRWHMGEHALIAAPTGAGKTTLMSDLVKLRSHVVIFVTKNRDETFRREFPEKKGWTILREWPKHGPEPWENKVLLWPKSQATAEATIRNQRRVFHKALEQINKQGNRCVVFDETLYLTDPKFVGLGQWLSYLSYHGRSSGISVVSLTQRPAWVPVVVYSSVTHAYIARTRDRNDTKRLADLGGVDTKEVSTVLAGLPGRHDYVYLNPQGDAEPSIINTRA